MIKAYSPQTILITGGAGFIGSHVVRKFVRRYPEKKIINLDLLTYAGNLENLWDIEQASNYTFIKGDIADQRLVQSVFEQYHPDGVINLAAESHVDRSLDNPSAFAQTNILGTLSLLQAARAFWVIPARTTGFIKFRQMKFMVLLKMGCCLPNIHPLIQGHLIQRRKHQPTILLRSIITVLTCLY